VTLVAGSRVMREVMSQARRYAAADGTVLITGETGVGKNTLARFLHTTGTRTREPFVTVDCPALPDTLVESALFGHERGAFTGAIATRPGRFELAGRGTIYLDEVTALTPTAQGALLRVVEERRALRLGGTSGIDVHARVIASADVRLEDMVQAGTFRADLFHRLRVLTLCIPPIRERPDDILPLASCFLTTIAAQLHRPAPAISSRAGEALRRYAWPGNVRELRCVLERTLVGGVGDLIEAAALPLDVLEGGGAYLRPADTTRPTLDEVQRRYIELTLRYVSGSQTRAAAVLGISRKALWEKRKRYGLS
jgi:transcriptional regulator with PAS, ATPase and Fis domain